MSRAEVIRRAVIAFLECGRGAVVILLDAPDPIYVRADEAVAQLSEWRAEPEIIDAVARATTDYDPEHEVVVVREDAISFTVSIERRDDSETVGSVTWPPVNRELRPTLRSARSRAGRCRRSPCSGSRAHHGPKPSPRSYSRLQTVGFTRE